MPDISADDFLGLTQEKEQAPPKNKSMFDQVSAFARSAGQGLYLGALDEIQAGIATPITSILRGQSPLKEYQRNLAIARNQLSNYKNNYPLESLVGEVAGSIPSGNALAKFGLKAIPAAASAAVQANPILGGAFAGGVGSSVYGFNEGGGGLESRIQNAGEQGITGALVGSALGQASKMFGMNPPSNTSKKIAEQSSAKYAAATEKGGIIKPERYNAFLNSLDDKVSKDPILSEMSITKSPVKGVIEDLSLKKGKPLTLDEAQIIDESLSDVVDAAMNNGMPTKASLKIKEIQENLRDLVLNAEEADVIGGSEGFQFLKEARDLWSQSRSMRDIEKIIENSLRTDNPAMSLKTGFRNLLNNPKRTRGLKENEIKAIKNAANTGAVTDVLRQLGSRLIGIGSAVTGGVGQTAGSIAGSALSRNAATTNQLEKARRIIDVIGNRGNDSALLNLYNPNIARSMGSAGSGAINNLQYQEPIVTVRPSDKYK
jgi:hypothetical protein